MPDATGHIERDGVKIYYEEMGNGPQSVVLLPTWSLLHSRVWKGTAPYLSRYFRVVTFDGRGNGKSDRPRGEAPYAEQEFVEDALALMDHLKIKKAFTVSVSMGGRWNLHLAAEHADRLHAAIFISPAVPLVDELPERAAMPFGKKLDTSEGWAKFNRFYWLDHYQEFVEWFHARAQSEVHSTKQIEDAVSWSLDTTAEVLVETILSLKMTQASARALCKKVKCPVLVMHGDKDEIRPLAQGMTLAEATGGSFIRAEGCGHGLLGRHPVWVNHRIKEFIDRHSPPRRGFEVRTWTRPNSRRRRALFISSPIGLGHSRRDLAIARELRRLRPEVEIEWLAQQPVTGYLQLHNEKIHELSKHFASECAHFESQSVEHCQPAFPILRDMDEIMVGNYHVIHDAMAQERYDIVVGDEAWELDHHWHEDPDMKMAPFVWLTDVIGYIPMPEGGEREAFLTADYNAEMIERIARFGRVRDLALFIGNHGDIPEESMGPGLPTFPDWTEKNYEYTGYILGFDPAQLPARDALRDQFGYKPDEKICIAAVGGMATGQSLLQLCIDAFPEARRQIPELRLIIVAGPRVDPASLRPVPGVEIRGYVPNLYQHMMACDLALVHGGLTQTMDLIAARVPFIVVPYARHWEQNFWVRRRLSRYHAGRYLDSVGLSSATIARTMTEEITRPPRAYRPVEDGSARAAQMIARLL
ncbi:MAG TPA: alpha/beta fold hydrolase [Kofleriaceae bacterium]|nr:alpha/beta fold hydrolase [Kofleriaceae bacterium]